MRHPWLLILWLTGLMLVLLTGCGDQASGANVEQGAVPPSPTNRPTESRSPPRATSAQPAAPTATALPSTAPPAPTESAGNGMPAAPVQLLIPRLGVAATIEAVGQDATGAMAAPEAVEATAWYERGARPGALGNAVLSGHLDDYKQDPAVFWRLHELEVGDEVIVVDGAGTHQRFEVLGQEIYRHDQAPLERIFGYTIQHNLNLITCNGTWDANALNYDHRLVVYTRLIEE